MNLSTYIVFPDICGALGGACRVELTPRLAKVTMPGMPGVVRLPRRLCPPVDKLTSFNLADAVHAFLNS